jgi:hypothetical protein
MRINGYVYQNGRWFRSTTSGSGIMISLFSNKSAVLNIFGFGIKIRGAGASKFVEPIPNKNVSISTGLYANSLPAIRPFDINPFPAKNISGGRVFCNM